MSTVDFHWYDPDKTVLRFTVSGRWTWGDLHRQLKRATLWLDTHDRSVSAVIDLRGGERLPAGIVGHVRSLPNSYVHPRADRRMILLGVPDDVRAILRADGDRLMVGEFTLCFAADDAAIGALLSQP